MQIGSAASTLLVVDANGAARQIRIEALQRHAFTTTQACNGREALEDARLNRPDLIIVDVTIAAAAGGAFCTAVRGDDGIAKTPILLTCRAADDPAVIVDTLNAGADDYLVEPVDPELLVAKVNTLLGRRALECDLARANAELASRAATGEAQLRAVFENALDSILIADDQGRYVDVNPAACALLGASKDELLGRSAADFLGLDAEFGAAWAGFLKRGSSTGEREFRRVDGREFQAEFAARANIVPGRHLSIVRDVTERKRLEEHLRQVQRLDAVGRLAGGIAHDYNNLLTVILGAAELLTEELPPGSFAWRQASEARAAATRAASLTSQLLAFSRRQLLRPTRLDLSTVIRDMQPMLQRLAGEHIALSVSVADGLPAVRVDQSQFGQVIANLVANARDAMPTGGTLIIETRRVHLDAEYAARHVGVEPGPYVMLAVSDTGSGIDPATRKRIFEPFFTTKEMGKGTGLGLATVYGIVKQSGGNIWVYSEPGRGTTFKVYVPEAPADPGGSTAAGTRREQLVRGEGQLLIVEDEPGVRAIARQILQRCGYRVTVASDGPDALVQCRRDAVQFDLVITDVVMPGMSGSELVSRLRADRPGLRVLYTSGYTEDAVIHHGVAAGAHFLAKPFTPSELARKVRQVLEDPPADLSAAS
jgi:two-component system cell cycle sensor histidine kinase/response regulator CckA